MNYYNEWEPYPAQWLRNLAWDGHIPIGTVDERSISDVQAKDLKRATQAHFFAGIGGWPLALKLAGWPESEPVWTGSCPCQPFSVAGGRKGEKDKRHLWPEFFRLIAECRPPVVFGEQVASKDGRNWLAGVRADLERVGYEVGAADLCAASAGEKGEGWILRGDRLSREGVVIGAPHIRQRLYWVAHTAGWKPRNGGVQRSREHGLLPEDGRPGERSRSAVGVGEAIGVADGPADRRLEERQNGRGRPGGSEAEGWPAGSGLRGAPRGVGVPGHQGLPTSECEVLRGERRGLEGGTTSESGRPSPWESFDVLPCVDGKARRVESGTFPLAHGIPCRVGKLRAYGNAIVPELAAEFIKAYLGARQ